MTYTAEHKKKQVGIGGSPQADLSLIVGTAKGLWTFAPDSKVELEGRSIEAIATTGEGLWAIADGHSLWHRPLTGEWCNVASISNLELNCVVPTSETVLVGTLEAHLMKVVGDRLENIHSFDQAEGRKQWYTPWGGAPDVRSIAVGHAGELYINIHVGGIVDRVEGGYYPSPLSVRSGRASFPASGSRCSSHLPLPMWM